MLLGRFWGDDEEEEDPFTPVITKNQKKRAKNKNKQVTEKTYNTRKSNLAQNQQ